jgi:hypothetical protein
VRLAQQRLLPRHLPSSPSFDIECRYCLARDKLCPAFDRRQLSKDFFTPQGHSCGACSRCHESSFPYHRIFTMHTHRFFRTHSRLLRRLITAVALAAYLGSVWGYPLPQFAAVDASTPFPCQHHRCGCQSAAQCWNNCCCFTPAERLAWAREHRVEIPSDVEATLLAAVAADSGDVAQHACCAHEHDHADHEIAITSAADHDQAATVAGHCQTTTDEKDHRCSACASNDPAAAIGWVLGIEARKCRGLSTLWVTSGASLPPLILPLWQYDWTPAGQVALPVDRFASLLGAPPVPPPQV